MRRSGWLTRALWPFGRQLVKRADAGVPSTVGNIIWIIFAGWWLALAHITTAIALVVTIIGIPLAWANIKLIPVSLVPLGRVIAPVEAEQDQPLKGRLASGSSVS